MNALNRILLCVALALPAQACAAKMHADPVQWTVGDKAFEGVLVYDEAGAAKRPGLVMVPDWMGMTDAAIAKAKHVAGDDYVVLVADVWGKGTQPRDNGEAGKMAGALRDDPATLRARINAALAVLRGNEAGAPLDATKLGAFGYCFGGTTVLELARSGADLAAVVTFHGGLGTSMPASKGHFKPSVLVLNGADDRGTAGDVAGFKQEMDAAGADWQFVDFSNTVHCFALPDANSPPGCVYNPLSARRAERMMAGFLDERFGISDPD
ncbi:MAG TPA: dienelactone hydrolase family protein [Luteimonas sp.]